MSLIERQVIVTWHTPEEKLPEKGETVVATVSGRTRGAEYVSAFALLTWDGIEWNLIDIHLDEFTVHAWCDLEPYGMQGVKI